MPNMVSEKVSNHFYSINLGDTPIVTYEQPTVDGRFVSAGEAGTFETPIGQVVVDFTKYEYEPFKRNGNTDGIVIVSGDGLKRPVRETGVQDAIKHVEAVTGVHRVYTGRRGHGNVTIGGEKTLDVHLPRPRYG